MKRLSKYLWKCIWKLIFCFSPVSSTSKIYFPQKHCLKYVISSLMSKFCIFTRLKFMGKILNDENIWEKSLSKWWFLRNSKFKELIKNVNRMTEWRIRRTKNQWRKTATCLIEFLFGVISDNSRTMFIKLKWNGKHFNIGIMIICTPITRNIEEAEEFKKTKSYHIPRYKFARYKNYILVESLNTDMDRMKNT